MQASKVVSYRTLKAVVVSLFWDLMTKEKQIRTHIYNRWNVKQTIFNASLEDSMNLVIEVYQNFIWGFQWKRLWGKDFRIYYNAVYPISNLPFKYSAWFSKFSVFLYENKSHKWCFIRLGFVGFIGYLIDLTKIKNQSILSYYYFKKNLEAYRQLADYSIEDWYGKESKRYKESLDQEV